MNGLYKHYSNYQGKWPWPNFNPQELACKHCGEFYLDEDSLDNLQYLRKIWGKAIVINSAHRCPVHNKAVGGTENSQHLKIAFDCACHQAEQEAFIKAAKQAGFKGIGRYRTRNFVHLDMGPSRQWAG